jgi:hypothetical protein
MMKNSHTDLKILNGLIAILLNDIEAHDLINKFCYEMDLDG